MRIFLAGGESRHWLHFPLVEATNASVLGKPSHPAKIQGGYRLALSLLGGTFDEVEDADLSSRKHNISDIYCPEPHRGGL